MTPARLRTFVTLAETGSVREAARRLVVTESAVSASVSALARDLGVPLVRRDGRGLRLTEEGAVYAGYARRVLGLLDEALVAARGEADPGRGTLRLAAVTTAADHVLPAVLAELRTAHPGLDLRLEVGPSSVVWRAHADHQVDLVIAGRPPTGHPGRVLALGANELVVVAPPSMGRVDLARATWLLREPGSGTRASCEALLEALQMDPPRLTLGSNGAVVAGAVAGLGVSLVSRQAVVGLLATGELVERGVPGTPLRRPWHAVGARTSPGAVRLAVEVLVAHGWRQPGRGAGATRGAAPGAAPESFSPSASTRRGMTGPSPGS